MAKKQRMLSFDQRLAMVRKVEQIEDLEAFAREVVANGYDERAAARACNIPPEQARCLMDSALVQRAIVAEEEREGSPSITRTRLIAEAGGVAKSDLTDIVSWGADGKLQIRGSDELPAMVRRSIKAVKITAKRGADGEEWREITFQMHDKNTAMATLGRWLGMERQEQQAKGPLVHFEINLGPQDGAVEAEIIAPSMPDGDE
jgi:hypothetical protein